MDLPKVFDKGEMMIDLLLYTVYLPRGSHCVNLIHDIFLIAICKASTGSFDGMIDGY